MKRGVNIAESVLQRLRNLNKQRNEDFNFILIRYTIERLLYRLTISRYSEQFVLKGAMLFAVWTAKPYRPTKDLDLLGFVDNSQEKLKIIFEEICQLEVEKDDGLIFDAASLKIAEIKEDDEYRGQRINLKVRLGNARIGLQVDIGFGDAIVPAPEVIKYPTLLAFPAPHIKAYSSETVVAEKLHAMVNLGILNSRMKDFYDLYVMAKQFTFKGQNLVEAIAATFKRRKTEMPRQIPVVFGDDFSTDETKNKQWKAFIRRSKLGDDKSDFTEVMKELRNFLLLPLSAASENKPFTKTWKNGESWTNR